MLVVLLKKTGYNTGYNTEIENKLTDHNHDKYIEFNKLAADIFNARLAQANLIANTDLMLNCCVLTEKLWKIKQKIYFLKRN